MITTSCSLRAELIVVSSFIPVSSDALYSYSVVFSLPVYFASCSYPIVLSFSAEYSLSVIPWPVFVRGHLSGRNSCSCRWRPLAATMLRIESANSGYAQTVKQKWASLLSSILSTHQIPMFCLCNYHCPVDSSEKKQLHQGRCHNRWYAKMQYCHDSSLRVYCRSSYCI
jgi:hypothetical protein